MQPVAMLAVVVVAMLGAQDLAAQPNADRGDPGPAPLFGFTAFPYDMTLEALQRTQSLVLANSTLYAVHLDDGVPWREALADDRWPTKPDREWRDIQGRIPRDRPLFVAITPLDKDRKNLAPALPGSAMPRGFSSARLDDPQIRSAYLNYARRAVTAFKPRFLNIGIEAGELAHRNPRRWSQYAALYEHVRVALKKEYPDLVVGMSFGLQSLMDPQVSRIVKPVVEASDYLGVSFYPHMSGFGEKFGAPALPAGADAWRSPLTWLRTYTRKPIAICETGFSTRPVRIPRYSLDLGGDAESQAAYVRDLMAIARSDRFLFVVWFCPVDYDRLYEKLPRGSEAALLWRNTGLFDADVHPKPALSHWKAGMRAGAP